MFKIMKYILKNTLLKIRNIKTITFAIIIAVTIWSYNHPLRELTYSIKYPVTWCVLSFLILFWFGIIYINSDIPYMQHSNMYQIIRTGRISWALGQLGGTFFRSFILVVFTAFCSIVSLLPQIEWSLQWGKLIHTIAMTNAAIQYNLKYVFYYQILGKYSPLQLMIITIVICTFISMFLSSLMFMISLYFNHILAVSITAALTIMLFFVVNIHPKIRYILAKFIPTVWAKVVQVNSPVLGYYWVPSIKYMFAFLLIGNIILIILILIKVKKCEFNWENEDI
jgi:hypothetical protein